MSVFSTSISRCFSIYCLHISIDFINVLDFLDGLDGLDALDGLDVVDVADVVGGGECSGLGWICISVNNIRMHANIVLYIIVIHKQKCYHGTTLRFLESPKFFCFLGIWVNICSALYIK